MGTRLYIQSTDESVLCRMYSISLDGLRKYKAIRTTQKMLGFNFDYNPTFFPGFRSWLDDQTDEFYKEDVGYAFHIFKEEVHPDLFRVEHFMDSGYGRLNEWCYDSIKKWGLDIVCGGVTEKEKIVQLILNQTGIDLFEDQETLDKIECVHWS